MIEIIPTPDQYDNFYCTKPLTDYWLNHVQNQMQQLSDIFSTDRDFYRVSDAMDSFRWLHLKWIKMEEHLYQANKHLTWYTRRVCIIR